MNKNKAVENRVYWLLFAIISFVFLFTRLFRLDMVPYTPAGMHFDEMSAAYDAWCIQGWGVDRHLTRYPVFFMNTGPGQNALYIYLAAIVFRLFGFSLFKFRLVAVILATLAYVCLFFLSRRFFGKDIISLVPSFLMTVMPVFLMSEHWGLESYLFLSFSIIAFSSLVLSLDKREIKYYAANGLLWGITFYTYGVSYIVIPLFFILVLCYLLYIKKTDLKMIGATSIPMILLGIPLAAEQMVIAGIIEPFSIFGMDFFPMDPSRAGEMSIFNIPQNILTSARVLLSKDYLLYSSVPQFGTIFYFSIPFMIIGACVAVVRTFRSIKTKDYDPIVLIFLYYVSGRFISLMTANVNTNKACEIYFPYMMFTAIGINYLVLKINKKWVLPGVVCIYLFFFIPFGKYVYSSGEDSWNYQTRPRTEEYIIEDIHLGLAIQQAKAICGDRKLQMIINDVEGRYLQICLFAGTSPHDYNKDGYEENGYSIGIPEELDMSGDTVYLIEDQLHHISDYLAGEGFTNEVPKQGQFIISYR